ncbi:hypothetical protein [Streptomyces sp. NPDC055189]
MAFSISFQRAFRHKAWTDAVDRVSAGGDNGFNIRFQTLEADLDTIGARFDDVTNSLNSLAQGVELERVVNVAPILTATGSTGWELSTGTARKPGSATDVSGAVPVALPPGGRIAAFRALGNNTGTGTLTLELMRQDLTGQGLSPVVRIQVSGQAAAPNFDRTEKPSGGGGIDVIDAGSSYFVLARLQHASTPDNVFLTGFQVLYRAR